MSKCELLNRNDKVVNINASSAMMDKDIMRIEKYIRSLIYKINALSV